MAAMDGVGIPCASPIPLNPPPNAGDYLYTVLMICFFLVPALMFFYVTCVAIYDARRRHRGLGNAADIEAADPSPPPPPDERRIKEIAAGCTECAICLGEYASDADGVRRRTMRPCGHRFHQLCIDAWLQKEPLRRGCPICRGVFRDSSDSVHHKSEERELSQIRS